MNKSHTLFFILNANFSHLSFRYWKSLIFLKREMAAWHPSSTCRTCFLKLVQFLEQCCKTMSTIHMHASFFLYFWISCTMLKIHWYFHATIMVCLPLWFKLSVKFCNRLAIIDEMDYLITKDRAALNDLFMLTTFPFSRIILIGIFWVS